MFTVIAEIGNTHIGNLDRAKHLANLAATSGANIVKFQKRNPYESVPRHLWDKPHPNEMFAYGKTYLEHRLNIELPIDQHELLKQYCEEIGIEYCTSVFDISSAEEVIPLKPKKIKIPSCCNTHWKLLNVLLNDFDGEIHISLGMTTKMEREAIYGLLKPHLDRVVAYHCTSEYPVPMERLFINEIFEMKKLYPRVGFSNHGKGIAVDVAAAVLGASYIERHFIDDRTFRHTDSAASLEPQGFDKLVRDLKAIGQAMKNKPDSLTEIEQEQRKKLRYYDE